jgi:hypothetical protein
MYGCTMPFALIWYVTKFFLCLAACTCHSGTYRDRFTGY